VNTLENYTRLPVAILGSEYLGWGNGVYSNVTYFGKEKIKIIRLTELGYKKAKLLTESTDLRIASIESYSTNERAWLAQYGYYSMALRAGINDKDVLTMVETSSGKVKKLIKELKISDPERIIFNPSLQESDLVLKKASEISE
jgi:hypothetical protein